MGFFGCSATGWAAADSVCTAPGLTEFIMGLELRAIAADTAAGTTLGAFGAELDLEEVLVSTAGFDCAGGFTCGGAFTCGCECKFSGGEEITDACTFDTGGTPTWTPPDCCCMYHQPPPTRSRAPAAIA